MSVRWSVPDFVVWKRMKPGLLLFVQLWMREMQVLMCWILMRRYLFRN